MAIAGATDAALRLLRVADDGLVSSKTSASAFFTAARTVADPTARVAQMTTHINAALDGSRQALAAVKLASAGTEGAQATAAMTDATNGVSELTRYFQSTIERKGTGAQILESRTNEMIDSVHQKILTAGGVLRGGANGGPAATGDTYTALQEAVRSNLTDGLTEEHLSGAAQKAQELGAGSANMPTLTEIAPNMVDKARAGDYSPTIGRDKEINELISVVGRKRKPNAMLLGDAGVGKTQIVEGLASRIASGDVPDSLRDAQLYNLDGSTVDKDTMGKVMQEVAQETAAGGNVIVFTDEAHQILGNKEIANQLKPALARGDLHLIGATTWDEYNRDIAKDGAVRRRFQNIAVDELDKADVTSVLFSQQGALSQHHGIQIMDSGIAEAQRLSKMYADQKQPDPAITLIDHAASTTKTAWAAQKPVSYEALERRLDRARQDLPMLQKQVAMGDPRAAKDLAKLNDSIDSMTTDLAHQTEQLTEERQVLGDRQATLQKYLAAVDAGNTDAADQLATELQTHTANVAALRQKYPEAMLSDVVDDVAVRRAAEQLYNRTISADGADAATKALGLEDAINKKVINQPEAAAVVGKAAIRNASGMKDPNGPAGVFIFLGHTGTGKTETVRTAAEVLTGDKNNMVKLDMGEFSEAHSVSKMFGAPPGYVGYNDAPRFAEVKKKPEAHILFDEAEKGHPTIYQKLLAFMEEGRATLGDGSEVDATGTTMYLTMNLTRDQLKQFFKPEFLNRVTAVVDFNDLRHEDIESILNNLRLPEVLDRAKSRGVDLTVTDAAKSRIADYGYDPAMGARPLNRSVQNHITDPVAEMILKLKAAGKKIDENTTEPATLDVDPAGRGFVMTSADGSVTIPIEAKPASESLVASDAAKAASGWNVVPEPMSGPQTETGTR